MDPKELRQYIISLEIEPFRAGQISSWIYKKGVLSFTMMTDIPASLREKLAKTAKIEMLSLKEKTRSSDRGATKYLFTTDDGLGIETVKIKDRDRTTVCVSSQVGCPMRCAFCATGKNKFKRNLSAGEIIYQVLYFTGEEKETITNVVFMGMGEPLLNYNNVLKAVRIMNSKDAMNMGIRRMTISTCGLPEKIKRLAREGLDVNLSVSLNAASEAIRSKLMPVNRDHPIRELISAVKYYTQMTGRRVTFDYVMIKEENDSIKDAKDLAALLEGMLCHVNLILFNKVKDSSFLCSSKERIELFLQILAHHGVNATIRNSRGSDIRAACGQLAGK